VRIVRIPWVDPLALDPNGREPLLRGGDRDPKIQPPDGGKEDGEGGPAGRTPSCRYGTFLQVVLNIADLRLKVAILT
jgi:hypothetical protein